MSPAQEDAGEISRGQKSGHRGHRRWSGWRGAEEWTTPGVDFSKVSMAAVRMTDRKGKELNQRV